MLWLHKPNMLGLESMTPALGTLCSWGAGRKHCLVGEAGNVGLSLALAGERTPWPLAVVARRVVSWSRWPQVDVEQDLG